MSSTGHAAGIDLGAVLRAERDINGAGGGGGGSRGPCESCSMSRSVCWLSRPLGRKAGEMCSGPGAESQQRYSSSIFGGPGPDSRELAAFFRSPELSSRTRR